MKHTHTYTAHITFLAEDDAAALLIAQAIQRHHAPTAMHVSDADDYAETIDVDLLCACGAPAADRIRIGDGSRHCAECAANYAHGPYPIEDTDV